MGIAQLVEHLVVVQGAAGSSPVTHPKEKPRETRGFFVSRIQLFRESTRELWLHRLDPSWPA